MEIILVILFVFVFVPLFTCYAVIKLIAALLGKVTMKVKVQ